MEEVWKPVETGSFRNEDGSWMYEVSNLGNVRRAAYIGYKNRHYGAKLLKPSIANGFYSVKLCGQSGFPIHELVAEAFIPKPGVRVTARHISGDRTDNSLDNIKWVRR